ncbi:hypothetical protein P261_01000 [Lachnospiraceae bacterium TWA4]|nr:hypothetical protein P261_01000 [Lachnospiraceae bacterium TWA4]
MRQLENIGLRIKCLSHSLKRGLNYLSTSSLPEEFQSMTGTQGMFIGYIRSQRPNPVFQKDLEATFNIRRATATKILQLMETNGLIIREPVPEDARLKKLTPTPKGEQFADLLRNNIERMEREMTRDIPKEDLQTFLDVVDKIIQNIESLKN